MEDPVILHADCNNFFASCECLERPELRDVPMAVAGDPRDRLGVVVAKNEVAKRYGVKTTDTVQQARSKCPDIVFLPPRHEFYRAVSERVNAIYQSYTDFVESASIDESYLDVSWRLPEGPASAGAFADALRARVREEIGITISVGVSFCKVFAKMGSDYRKPDATTVITRENFRALLWDLPVSDLLFAGRASAEALKKRQILTIGDLARREEASLRAILGKHGETLWRYANGLDRDPVRRFDDVPLPQSISRGHTFPKDLTTDEEIMAGLNALSDEVARALRRNDMLGEIVTVQLRWSDLRTVSRQKTLRQPTCLQHEIRAVAFALVKQLRDGAASTPVRSMTVGVSRLCSRRESVRQLSLFDFSPGGNPDGDPSRRERLEAAVEAVRRKHGDDCISLGYRPGTEQQPESSRKSAMRVFSLESEPKMM